jgi:hypothetical protein
LFLNRLCHTALSIRNDSAICVILLKLFSANCRIYGPNYFQPISAICKMIYFGKNMNNNISTSILEKPLVILFLFHEPQFFLFQLISYSVGFRGKWFFYGISVTKKYWHYSPSRHWYVSANSYLNQYVKFLKAFFTFYKHISLLTNLLWLKSILKYLLLPLLITLSFILLLLYYS